MILRCRRGRKGWFGPQNNKLACGKLLGYFDSSLWAYKGRDEASLGWGTEAMAIACSDLKDKKSRPKAAFLTRVLAVYAGGGGEAGGLRGGNFGSLRVGEAGSIGVDRVGVVGAQPEFFERARVRHELGLPALV